MKKPFEYTVIEFLDGQLSPRRERAFLEAIANDPEKRDLLEQHRTLRKALSDRKHPQSVPLSVQRALAATIPSLERTLPAGVHALHGSNGLGRPGVRLFSTLRFRQTWISLLTAASFVTATFGVLYLTDNDSDSSAVVENQSLGDGNMPAVRERSGQSRTDGSGSAVLGVPVTNVAARNDIAGNERTAPAGHRYTLAAETRMTSSASSIHAVETGAAASARTSMENPVPYGEDLLPSLDARPIAAFSETRVPDVRRNTPTPLPYIPFVPLDGPVFLCIESGAARFDARGSDGNRSSQMNGVYLAALRYEVSPFFTVGLEAGQSYVSREALVAKRTPIEPGSSTDIVIIDRGMVASMLPWLRLHGQYTFNPESRIQLRLDAGGGALLTGEHPFVFSTGISTGWYLAYNLELRFGAHYSGSWLAPSHNEIADPLPSSGVVGIIRRNSTVGYNYNSSIDFRFGVGVRVW